PTVVTAAGHPACHGNGLANAFGIACAEFMGARHVAFPLLSSTWIKSVVVSVDIVPAWYFAVLTGPLVRLVGGGPLPAAARFVDQLVSAARFGGLCSRRPGSLFDPD